MHAKILIWGGKSQAHILHEMIIEQKLGTPMLIFDASIPSIEFESNAQFLRDVETLKFNLKKVNCFVVGIGGSHGYARHKIAKLLEASELKQISILSENAILDQSVAYGAGLQMMPGAVAHKFVSIGENVILNTNSTVDHDCEIGDGVHIMGSAAIAGNVCIGDFATIGTNATILPNIVIGSGAYVGAGAVVTKNVEPNSVYVGIPAKKIREHELLLDSYILDQFST
jgi:acetyltransferase EpsM